MRDALLQGPFFPENARFSPLARPPPDPPSPTPPTPPRRSAGTRAPLEPLFPAAAQWGIWRFPALAAKGGADWTGSHWAIEHSALRRFLDDPSHQAAPLNEKARCARVTAVLGEATID
jgi:hypothetical protein